MSRNAYGGGKGSVSKILAGYAPQNGMYKGVKSPTVIGGHLNGPRKSIAAYSQMGSGSAMGEEEYQPDFDHMATDIDGNHQMHALEDNNPHIDRSLTVHK